MSETFNSLVNALDGKVVRRLVRLDVGAMTKTPPPPVPWLVEGVLVKSTVTMLAGREGTGKSALALALAASCGTGEPVAGLRALPEARRVLYVDAENGRGEIHRRLYGLEVVPDALVYVEAVPGFDLLAHVAELAALGQEHTPDVIVLDSLRSLAPTWEENESAAAEQVLAPLRKLARDTGAAVLVIHHAGKGVGGQEYRGSSGIGAAVEIGLTLARDPEDPQKRTRRCLTCWKMRPAAEPEPVWLALDGSGGTLSIISAPPFDREAEKRSERDHIGDRIVAILAQAGRPLAKADLFAKVPADPDNGTAKRTLERLIADGKIVRERRGIYALGQAGPTAGPTDPQLDL